MLKNFSWRGIDDKGFKTKGELSAKNRLEANAILSGQKVTVLKMTRQFKLSFLTSDNKITENDITDLTIEFSSLISSGIPLLNALQVLKKSTQKRAVKNLIQHISRQIENGGTLSDAMRSLPYYFDALFVSLIYAGEQSGTLDITLNDMAVYREKINALKRKIKKALFYPAVVLAAAFCITCAMLIFVIPQFERLFQSVGADLPLLTKWVIAMADFMHSNFAFLCISPPLLIYTAKLGLHYFKSWRYFIDRYALKLPLFGEILSAAIFARCFRTIATLLSAGLPLLETLHITANVANNHLYAEGFMSVYTQIKSGQPFSAALEATRLFPPRITQMVSIGEESGQLDTLLKKVSDYFENQANDKVHYLSQLLEPFLMVVLCVLVGILVIAMYLPIFKLGSIF